jgi:hypothetical protein
MSDFKKYSINRTIKKGINDLKCEFGFIGSSQGDESATNSVAEYLASAGWLITTLDKTKVDITNQKEVDAAIQERREANQAYIKQLQEVGEYGKEVSEELNIFIKPNPLFDR